MKKFINPVYTANVADPTICKVDNLFYLFHTGPLYSTFSVSTDMIHWTSSNICPFDSETVLLLTKLSKLVDSDAYIYAPTLVKNGDLYLLYISLTYKCTLVLWSNDITKPFHFVTPSINTDPKRVFELTNSQNKLVKIEVLINKEITNLDITFEDSCVAQEIDGKWYLMWGSHGKMYQTQLTNNGCHLLCNPKFKRIAGCSLFARNVFEGLYAYKHGDYWYLFVAKGNYTSKTDPYEITVGRSKTLTGTFRNKFGIPLTWGFGSVILKPDNLEHFLGGGHTGEIFTDDSGQDYIFYQRQLTTTEHYRPLFLQRIFWKNNWPYFQDGVTQSCDIVPYLRNNNE